MGRISYKKEQQTLIPIDFSEEERKSRIFCRKDKSRLRVSRSGHHSRDYRKDVLLPLGRELDRNWSMVRSPMIKRAR